MYRFHDNHSLRLGLEGNDFGAKLHLRPGRCMQLHLRAIAEDESET
jgi:hypothetical protein